MLHKLNGVNGQQLVGEVTGAVLLSSDPVIALAAARCFKSLLCALLNRTIVNPLRLVQRGHKNKIVNDIIAWMNYFLCNELSQ